MVPSKTYLKFKETRSQEDLETLNKYLNRLNEISSKLNDDALELSAEEENKLYDEDEDLTDKVLRLLFGDTFFIFISEYSLDGYDSWEDTVEDLMEDLCTHQETIEDLGKHNTNEAQYNSYTNHGREHLNYGCILPSY